ncbi:MAG: hypothetical protein ACKODX_07920 [Gemmata sp.]
MTLAQRPTPRRGMGSLDAVLTLGATFPLAAALYWMFERGLEIYLLTLGTTVGWPLM